MSQDLSAREVINKYLSGPDRLEETITGLTETQLDTGPEGEWTIRQIVHHIVDGDDLWHMPAKVALGSPGSSYDQEFYYTDNSWAKTLVYDKRPIGPALALFRANRFHLAQLMEYLADGWDRHLILHWARSPQGERVTVADIVTSQASHALKHVDDIRKIRQDKGI